MSDIQRRSPVQFSAAVLKTEMRDRWRVVLEYDREGDGPYLVDLSHKTRWDLQDANIGGMKPCDVAVPDAPNRCALKNGVLINRMNRTQAAIWHLIERQGERQGQSAPAFPQESAYTDVTESTLFLALFGPRTFSITEKLSSLDFLEPGRETPFLLQGPFSHVPCQIVTVARGEKAAGGILLTCSRGYGHSMTHAIMDAGAEFGLRPAGEKRFSDWIGAIA